MEGTLLCIQIVLSKHASYLKHPLVPACLGKWPPTVFHSRYQRCTICPPCPAWRSSTWGETPSLTPPPTAARYSATSQTHQNRCVAMRVWGCEGVVLWWLWVWGCDGVWVYENCRCDEVGKTYDQAYLLPLPLSRLPSVSPSFPFPFPSLLPPSLPPSFLASLLILKVILDGKKPSRDELELTASLLTPKGHRRVH